MPHCQPISVLRGASLLPACARADTAHGKPWKTHTLKKVMIKETTNNPHHRVKLCDEMFVFPCDVAANGGQGSMERNVRGRFLVMGGRSVSSWRCC